MAVLTVDLRKIVENFTRLRHLCLRSGREIVAVTKLFQTDPVIMEALVPAGARAVAETCLCNLGRVPAGVSRMLMRSSLSDIRSGLVHCDRVFLSELSFARELSALPDAGEKAVYVTVEGGDLREGLNLEELADFTRNLLALGTLRLEGIAVNYGCLRGKIPGEADLRTLVAAVETVRRKTGFRYPVISIGGTAVYSLLEHGGLPPEVNQIRMGEAIFFGHNMSLRKTIEGFHHDALRFSGEIIEIKEKRVSGGRPSGYNAFGSREKELHRGIRRRAILDFGELDSPRQGLTPVLQGIEIVGSTHDYTVLDITGCGEPLSPGDRVVFDISYTSAAQAILSPFVEKDIRLFTHTAAGGKR